MSRERPGPARTDWADPRRLAALTDELRRARTMAGPGSLAESRPRDQTGRVLSAIKATIRLDGSGTVRYFDSWRQLADYFTGEDFSGIAGQVKSVAISHRPDHREGRS
jgi:hypothetical protein